MWSCLGALARLSPEGRITVHKVASHQNHEGADLVEKWAFLGNDGADHSAGRCTRYTEEVSGLWHRATSDLEAAKLLREQVHHTMLLVSEAAVKQEAARPVEEPEEAAFPLPLQEVSMGFSRPVRRQAMIS